MPGKPLGGSLPGALIDVLTIPPDRCEKPVLKDFKIVSAASCVEGEQKHLVGVQTRGSS